MQAKRIAVFLILGNRTHGLVHWKFIIFIVHQHVRIALTAVFVVLAFCFYYIRLSKMWKYFSFSYKIRFFFPSISFILFSNISNWICVKKKKNIESTICNGSMYISNWANRMERKNRFGFLSLNEAELSLNDLLPA